MSPEPWSVALGAVVTFSVGGETRSVKSRTGRVLGLTENGATVAVCHPSGWRRRWVNRLHLAEPTDTELSRFLVQEVTTPPREADHLRVLKPRRGGRDA